MVARSIYHDNQFPNDMTPSPANTLALVATNGADQFPDHRIPSLVNTLTDGTQVPNHTPPESVDSAPVPSQMRISDDVEANVAQPTNEEPSSDPHFFTVISHDLSHDDPWPRDILKGKK